LGEESTRERQIGRLRGLQRESKFVKGKDESRAGAFRRNSFTFG